MVILLFSSSLLLIALWPLQAFGETKCPYYPNNSLYSSQSTTCKDYCCSAYLSTSAETACCSSSNYWWVLYLAFIPIGVYYIALIVSVIIILVCTIRRRRRLLLERAKLQPGFMRTNNLPYPIAFQNQNPIPTYGIV